MLRNPGLRSASQWVASEGDLGSLLRRAHELEALDLALRAHLDPALAAHCRVANIRGTQLVCLAHSSAAAARLRLMGQELLAQAGQRLKRHLTQLVVKIALPSGDAPRNTGVKSNSPVANGQIELIASLLSKGESQPPKPGR